MFLAVWGVPWWKLWVVTQQAKLLPWQRLNTSIKTKRVRVWAFLGQRWGLRSGVRVGSGLPCPSFGLTEERGSPEDGEQLSPTEDKV